MIHLKDYLGSQVVLYFYPKDATPTCTVEACSLRDAHPKFVSKNYAVIGVSADSVKSHAKFADKQRLPFALIADENRVIIDAYDVWGKKQVFGREMIGIIRTTFVIDAKGRIARVIDEVQSKRHAEQILDE
jgi:peroxiredoxin Q/BCP